MQPEPSQTSTMEIFFAKSSILDVLLVSECASGDISQSYCCILLTFRYIIQIIIKERVKDQGRESKIRDVLIS